MAEDKKQAAEYKGPKILVVYNGSFPEVYAPNLGAFKKGKSREFTDAFQIEQSKILIKANPDFEEVEK